MYGEKFIEKKIEGNKIIRISEFKDFHFPFGDLLDDLNDKVTDDWETLNDKGIYFDRCEEFHCFDADQVLVWVVEIIQEKKDDDEDPEDYAWLERWIEPLETAKGFTIYLQNMEDLYKNV